MTTKQCTLNEVRLRAKYLSNEIGRFRWESVTIIEIRIKLLELHKSSTELHSTLLQCKT